MDTSHILKVSILSDGCLGVFPETQKAMYQHVYREAAGVYWDDDLGCFKSTVPQDWSLSKWYQQILTVVRSGVGLQLVLCSDTEYEADLEGFADSIKLADQALWR